MCNNFPDDLIETGPLSCLFCGAFIHENIVTHKNMCNELTEQYLFWEGYKVGVWA